VLGYHRKHVFFGTKRGHSLRKRRRGTPRLAAHSNFLHSLRLPVQR
jgi:hypothetical protein